MKIVSFFTLLALVSFGSHKDKRTIGSIERLDPEMDRLIQKDAAMEIIAEGFDWTEGPLWVEKHQMLLFSDIPKNTIYKWTESKGTEVYLTPSGYTDTAKRGGETGSNALKLTIKGRLLLCQHGDRRIAVMDAPLDKPAPKFISLADNYNGKKFNSPNDAAVASNGDIYFTDPPYGLEKNMNDPKKELSFQGVYKIKKDGKLILLVDSITRPNGIELTPDGKTLFVSNSDGVKPRWYKYKIKGDALVNGTIFPDPAEEKNPERGGADGMKFTKKGYLFAIAPGGVWIFNPKGRIIGKLKIPERTSNCALSGDEKTLYITADMYVLRLKLRN
ncbi:MAG: SMP-30/gluconolactonase/LRE family protein [Flavisolibacter sp.]